MVIAGVIAEYNPFHNGHKYQLDEIRKRTGADYIIAAMSGDFVQRGTPAILDKYTRAEMALREGADLVLELPFLYATASAEMFALGGVSLLKNTGITDYLCFGAEDDNLALLTRIAGILAEEPESYQSLLRESLSSGLSFPAAREKALLTVMSGDDNIYGAQLSEESSHLIDVLHGSNNLLAIEYLKQLYRQETGTVYSMKIQQTDQPADGKFRGSEVHPVNQLADGKPGILPAMTPVLIQRTGDAYNSAEIYTQYASATAIRELLRPSPHPVPAVPGSIDAISGNTEPVPAQKPPAPGLLEILPDASVLPVLMAKKQNTLLFEDSLSVPLAYKLLSCKHNTAEPPVADCSKDLYNRIIKHAGQFQKYSDFCLTVKNKSITYSHVSHALLNLLFDVTEGEYQSARDLAVPYLRVLGFRRESASLLSLLKKNASVPVITSPADTCRQLSPAAAAVLQKDLYTSEFYNQLVLMQSGITIKNDYSHAMVII